MFREVDEGDIPEHPVVPIKTEHEGLTQCATFHYRVDPDGRRIQVKTPEDGTLRRTIRMNLPLICCPDMWIRHNYSLEDVVDTLNYIKPYDLWQLAVIFGIQLSNSSVRMAFSAPKSIHLSSKATVMIKIAQLLQKYYVFPSHNVLDKTHDEHVPALPVHRINARQYHYWKSRTPRERIDTSWLRPNRVSEFYHWREILLTPLWMEGDAIYMIRVVRRQVYIDSGRNIDVPATRPPVYLLGQDETYFGLADEAAFFLPEYDPNSKEEESGILHKRKKKR